MDARDEGPPALPMRSQRVIGAAVACGLVAMAAWYLASGGFRGGLVHHDAPRAAPAADFTVNVNTSAVTELAQLPGVGPATAADIVEHRRTRGPFTSHDELLDVPGIGPATLERMRPHLRPIRAPREAATAADAP